MADYDWFTPSTPEQVKINNEWEAKKKTDKKNCFDAAIAEGRRMLLSGEVKDMPARVFKREIQARARYSNYDETQDVLYYLKEHNELSWDLGTGVNPVNPKQPDPEILSKFAFTPVPVEVADKFLSKKDGLSTNYQRKLFSYNYIEKLLSEGSSILVRDASGEVRELEFTREQLHQPVDKSTRI